MDEKTYTFVIVIFIHVAAANTLNATWMSTSVAFNKNGSATDATETAISAEVHRTHFGVRTLSVMPDLSTDIPMQTFAVSTTVLMSTLNISAESPTLIPGKYTTRKVHKPSQLASTAKPIPTATLSEPTVLTTSKSIVLLSTSFFVSTEAITLIHDRSAATQSTLSTTQIVSTFSASLRLAPESFSTAPTSAPVKSTVAFIPVANKSATVLGPSHTMSTSSELIPIPIISVTHLSTHAESMPGSLIVSKLTKLHTLTVSNSTQSVMLTVSKSASVLQPLNSTVPLTFVPAKSTAATLTFETSTLASMLTQESTPSLTPISPSSTASLTQASSNSTAAVTHGPGKSTTATLPFKVSTVGPMSTPYESTALPIPTPTPTSSFRASITLTPSNSTAAVTVAPSHSTATLTWVPVKSTTAGLTLEVSTVESMSTPYQSTSLLTSAPSSYRAFITPTLVTSTSLIAPTNASSSAAVGLTTGPYPLTVLVTSTYTPIASATVSTAPAPSPYVPPIQPKKSQMSLVARVGIGFAIVAGILGTILAIYFVRSRRTGHRYKRYDNTYQIPGFTDITGMVQLSSIGDNEYEILDASHYDAKNQSNIYDRAETSGSDSSRTNRGYQRNQDEQMNVGDGSNEQTSNDLRDFSTFR